MKIIHRTISKSVALHVIEDEETIWVRDSGPYKSVLGLYGHDEKEQAIADAARYAAFKERVIEEHIDLFGKLFGWEPSLDRLRIMTLSEIRTEIEEIQKYVDVEKTMRFISEGN
jgi:hypothetical protein